MAVFLQGFLVVVAACLSHTLLTASPLQLVSTQSSLDVFTQNCANLLNGQYCELVTNEENYELSLRKNFKSSFRRILSILNEAHLANSFVYSLEGTSSNLHRLYKKVLVPILRNESYEYTALGRVSVFDIGKTAASHLPKVWHNYNFESIHKDRYTDRIVYENYYDDSICYDLSIDGLPKLPNGLGIGFINGIWNDFEGAKESVEYLSKLAGGYNIYAVYNATHGKMDIPECLMGLDYIATEPVRQLHKMWNSFFEKSSGKIKFLMICHSQGAIHVRNALLDYIPDLRARILIIAIAPGAYIYKETCAKVIHYRTTWWRDWIPRFDRFGAKREIDTIINLTSHSDAAFFDHEFMSLTYKDPLRRHISNYIKTKGEA